MTAIVPTGADALPAARPRPPGRGRVAELLRAAAAPVICAAAVTGLLSAWVITGGAGSVTRSQIQVSLAAVPMRAYLPGAAATIHRATTYLTIRNLSGEPDELLSAQTPVARRVILIGPGGPHGTRPVVTGLPLPAHGRITLSPLGADVVLLDPARYETDMTVPLTLTFRHAGQVHVSAAVTAPGAP
ncbi:MAG TPA: copper chaperone PCu(A)C [Streptosporangiaceae bacterium]|nr:copper chaperone PCu(A)C [Streptosporangiaceae bacterium]